MAQRSRAINAAATRWGYALFVLMLGIFIFPANCLAANYPPPKDRYVNDYARVLTSSDAADIRAMLWKYERDHGVVVVLLTIGSINDYDTPDTSIESFATSLFNTWGIGDAQRNDGVLILFAKNDRKVRIEVGRGYGKNLDAPMKQVIDQVMLPAFKREQYSSGIAAGARAVLDTLDGKLLVAPSTSSGEIRLPSVPVATGLIVAIFAVVAGLIRYNHILGRTCPQCKQRNIKVVMTIVAEPTYTSSGLQVQTRDCQSCGYHDERNYDLPMLHHSTSSSRPHDFGSSSSSSSGGGGGSSGGGSSDGGGASGGW